MRARLIPPKCRAFIGNNLIHNNKKDAKYKIFCQNFIYLKRRNFVKLFYLLSFILSSNIESVNVFYKDIYIYSVKWKRDIINFTIIDTRRNKERVKD